ncbi:ankyrin [Hypoxylon fragiforme]|uniref:ankyrin n=1 Tax=Hypoxylon fragiforme TaxID=63214 RepID=UPI0020C71769|nr:ankyrin [Hypoxylon fragiforme]KAI2607196.1 ankyrin [Hypoxylon fragiforme]
MPSLVDNMEHAAFQGGQQTRLRQLGEEWGLVSQPPSSPSPRPDVAPSYRVENDEFTAEELLKRQRIAESQGQQTKGGLSRAFTTKKKTWEYREIYNALVAHIQNQGSPGVAECLINKLNLVGGNLNLAQKSRTGLLSRRKSLDLAERSQVLQIAVRNGHYEMVEVLLPYADALSLDTALPTAMRNGNVSITRLLLRYGADASQTADGQDAFRQLCAVGGQPELIALIVGSEGRPSVTWISQSMVEAARAGCLSTVGHLSQSTADGNHDGAAALKAAVALGRRDIALAIILGNKPPTQPGLNEAFDQLMTHPNINPNEKIAMAEILLCAGANGDSLAKALLQATATYFLEMVHLLVSFGASIEYQDAMAMRKAVSKGKIDLVQVMLGGKSKFSPQYASECVELLPKKMRFEERHSFLNLLLRKGASGPPLDEALVDAVEAGDIEAVKLLLTPLFPGGKIVGSKDIRKGPRSMVFERHETASTDHKGALALQIAVKKGDTGIADLILTSRPPNPVALAQIFPSVRNLPSTERYQIAELFLRAGLTGPSVHSALENAIDEQPPHRDEKLISLFLRYNADVNFNEGHTITAAIAQKDVRLLERLLKSKPTIQVAAKAIPKVMEVQDGSIRLQMVNMLLSAGASQGGSEVSAAVEAVVQANPPDKRLLKTLLQQGNADVNVNGGAAVEHAVLQSDSEILEMILSLGQPNAESLDRGLASVGKLPASPTKTGKLDSLLRRTRSKDIVTKLLIDEVICILKTPPQNQNLSSLKVLLANGADINAMNAEALCRAVAAANMQLVEVLLTANPTPASMAFTMPHALRIRDLMDRLTFARKILEGGIPEREVNRALVFAISTYPDDIPLINILLARADTRDGLALLEAIKKEQQDVVELILGKKTFPVEILNTGFAEATRGKNKRSRSMSSMSLLKAGASGDVVSDALLAAATDGDVDFGTILVQNGGCVDHKDGQAIIESCKSGAVDILAMLLAGNLKVAQTTLQRGFQAATQIGDLKRRAEIFKLLLQMGVAGEEVDAQLVSAVRYGDNGKSIVELLLVYGASPDYNEGEAVVKAAQSAFLGNLEMLLGVMDVGGRQKRPSSHTLVRAMDACWDLKRDTRFTVISWIFQAGKPVLSAVNSFLLRAVNEEDPEERFIELLVKNRASPTSNGCRPLIDATRTLSVSAFTKLLDFEISSADATTVFCNAFISDNVSSWLSDRGYQIAQCLLEKGATGDGVGSAFAVVLGLYMEAHGELANKFVDLLLSHGADINYNHGEALQNAAAQGDPDLLRRLLRENPDSQALTYAFPRIFDATASEDDIHDLIALFIEYNHGESHMDVAFTQAGSEPVLIRALNQFPRSTKVLSALLDAGFYHDQITNHRATPEAEEEEPVTLLMWSLLQPQKKVSSNVINLLIERGAKVNYETPISRVTPVMLAIEARRHDIVKSLLLADAEVDVTDAIGRSPLSMASAIGGDLAISMMSNLLAAGASRNDGSLHNAARELNLQAMQVLVEYRHDPDFPSPLHGGRSALGELCLHSTDSIEMTPRREKAMEKAINFLLQSDSDITLQSEGKSALLLAFESSDPLTTTKVLLRADMWKFINKPFNYYTDGKFTYSPTMYVQRVMPEFDHKPQLLALLRANRGTDVYYANTGPQPEDAINMPTHIQVEEQERKARLTRIQKDDQEHILSIQRNKELASVQAQIWANQAELEDARKKRAHNADLTAMQERARVEEDLFNAAMRLQRTRHSVEVKHQEALTHASLTRTQAIADAELNVESQKRSRLLQWEREMGNERVGNANQLSSIRLREREDLEVLDKAADARLKTRILEQKKLVDSQSALAANIAGAGPAARRQIGFVSGELGPD